MFRFQLSSHSARKSARKSGFTLIELMVVIAIISLLAAILFPVFGQARDSARRSSCMSNLRQIGLGLQQYVEDYDETMPHNEMHTGGGTQTLFEVIQPYIKSSQVYICPSASEKAKVNLWNDPARPICTYAINLVYYDTQNQQMFEQNFNSSKLASLEDPTGTVFCGDSTPQSNLQNAFQVPGRDFFATNPVTMGSVLNSQGAFEFRHKNGANFVFMDGHVKWQTIAQAAALSKDGNAFRIFTRSLD